MEKSILESIGSEQPRLGMSRVWKLEGKASPSFPLDFWFLSAFQTAWPSSSILTNGKCLYYIIPVPWWHICGQGKLPRKAPMPSRVVIFWFIWRSGQCQFPERAQFCLGHQPSCSLALSWGSKGSGSGTKDDVVFALKLVQYAVCIDGLLYHFFGSLSFFS